MSFEQLQCPTCGAAVSIPPGADQVTCSYCRVTLRRQRGAGEAVLLPLGQVTSAIAKSGEQTQAAIGENMAATRHELQRMQLAQELTSLELRQATLQGEMRALQRMPPSKVTAQQLRQLGQQESGLQARIAEVHTLLNPPASGSAALGGQSKTARVPSAAGEAKRRGCVGWGLLLLAWFFFWPFLLPWTMIRSQSKPVRVAGYVVAVIVAYYLLLFLFAPRRQPDPTPEQPAAFQDHAYDLRCTRFGTPAA